MIVARRVRLAGVNRTIVELKYKFEEMPDGINKSVNRTIVELKCVSTTYTPHSSLRVNRTIVELKLR